MLTPTSWFPPCSLQLKSHFLVSIVHTLGVLMKEGTALCTQPSLAFREAVRCRVSSSAPCTVSEQLQWQLRLYMESMEMGSSVGFQQVFPNPSKFNMFRRPLLEIVCDPKVDHSHNNSTQPDSWLLLILWAVSKAAGGYSCFTVFCACEYHISVLPQLCSFQTKRREDCL